jgi:spermidine/putrescine transport system permease protein
MRGAILGLVAVLATAAVYTQLGALGLGLAPTAALLLLAVPAFAAGAVALRGGRPAAAARYPLGPRGPALAYYVAFFGVPLAFLVLFAFATPVGFGEVQYGFDLGNFEVALGDVYVDAFLRTLRFAAIGTLLTVLVGCPLAYWLARYVPDERKGLMLALVIVPFWTSFLIRTSSFLIAFSDDFPLARGLRASGSRRDGSASCTRTPPCRSDRLQLPAALRAAAYAALERIDWRLIDAAGDLGASPWTSFRQITARLAAPGIITGALLVFIPMMGEYIIPIVLGGGRIDLIGNVIGRSFLEQRDYAFGSALALLVMLALSGLIALYLYLSTRSEAEAGA